MVGKGSKRRPCQINRVEEGLRYGLAFGTITQREFNIGMKAVKMGSVTSKDTERTRKEKKAERQRIYMQTPEGRLTRSKGNKKYCQTLKGKKKGRKKSKKRREKYPEKIKAMTAVNNAIATGKMKKSVFCESCGLPAKTEGHHPDYSKLLKVNWLCKTCHTNIHNKNEKRVLCPVD